MAGSITYHAFGSLQGWSCVSLRRSQFWARPLGAESYMVPAPTNLEVDAGGNGLPFLDTGAELHFSWESSGYA